MGKSGEQMPSCSWPCVRTKSVPGFVLLKRSAAFLGEGCFHLCMVQPGRSFLSDKGLDWKKRKRKATPLLSLHGVEVDVFHIQVVFCNLKYFCFAVK